MTARRKSLDYVPPRVDSRVNNVSSYPGFGERIIRILGTDSTANRTGALVNTFRVSFDITML